MPLPLRVNLFVFTFFKTIDTMPGIFVAMARGGRGNLHNFYKKRGGGGNSCNSRAAGAQQESSSDAPYTHMPSANRRLHTMVGGNTDNDVCAWQQWKEVEVAQHGGHIIIVIVMWQRKFHCQCQLLMLTTTTMKVKAKVSLLEATSVASDDEGRAHAPRMREPGHATC
jgi:hypothetical protein